MADFTFSDGRAITFDLTKLTMREYNGLFSAAQSNDVDAEIVSRVAGITADEYRALKTSETLSLYEWKDFHRAFFKKCSGPLTDPK